VEPSPRHRESLLKTLDEVKGFRTLSSPDQELHKAKIGGNEERKVADFLRLFGHEPIS
jgi:hypothetical protein